MKDLIKNLLREGLMSEALISVDDDVNFIYDTYFRDGINKINKSGFVTPYLFKSKILNSSILKSKLSISANEKNPIIIYLNNDSFDGNFYNPIKGIISIMLNKGAINYAMEYGGDINKAMDSIYSNDVEKAKRFMNEFTESKVKGSIHHELSHWIDDTLRVGRVSKAIDYSVKHNTTMDKRGVKRYLQPMEIDAVMHNIYQLKQEYSDIWDDLTFNELVNNSPALHSAAYNYTPEEKMRWRRLIRTRMNREGLLGKNMGK